MQQIINIRSAIASPPRNIFVGVAGNGFSLGQIVDAIMTKFPVQTKAKYSYTI